MTAEKMLEEARKDIGMEGRPNPITREYAERHGADYLEAPWCDMAITYWAHHSGNEAVVLPEGDRALTIWHAEDGERLGRWHAGTETEIANHALPGAVVFFDWEGTDSIDSIDHVGLVEVNLGDGRVQTIEGNTDNACKRRVRGSSVIAGFWNPAYEGGNSTEAIVNELPMLKEGDQGPHVRTMHHLMIARDCKNLDGTGDTVFTPAHTAGIRALQQAAKIEADGLVGIQTWRVLLGVG